MSEIKRITYGVKLNTAEATSCSGRVFNTSDNVFFPTLRSALASMMEWV